MTPKIDDGFIALSVVGPLLLVAGTALGPWRSQRRKVSEEKIDLCLSLGDSCPAHTILELLEPESALLVVLA